jgi:hypothetical protein
MRALVEGLCVSIVILHLLVKFIQALRQLVSSAIGALLRHCRIDLRSLIVIELSENLKTII